MAASDSLSGQFGKKLLGHQLDIFGGETPIYSQEQKPEPDKPKEPEYIDVYHASDELSPPHRTPRPPSADLQGSRRVGPDDHLFVGSKESADDFRRPFMHHYRLPKSSIYPVTYSDDNAFKRLDWDHGTPGHEEAQTDSFYTNRIDEPTLWHSLVASRRSPEILKKAVPFTNYFEGNRFDDSGNMQYQTSYILPKNHMDELGIQYMGVTGQYDTRE